MMMNKKNTLKQALKTYYAGKTLSERQLDALQQISGEGEAEADSNTVGFNVAGRAGLMLASLALLAVLLGYFQPPAVIADAYGDIEKDAALYNGLPISMQQWMHKNQIASVPQAYPVEMSKFCQLDQYLTTHIRIAGAQQGVVHLFFHSGERPLLWRNSTGVMDKMSWKLLKVRDRLTLIVLYSHDMREKAVLHILQGILPELKLS